MKSKLALLGGPKAVKSDVKDIFTWPIVNKEMETKVLEILRAGTMSNLEVTKEFEEGFAKWHGMKYGLGHNNGTSALHSAFFGIGIGKGDEVICTAVTYWASYLPILALGGTIVFADVEPDTLNIDPDDIEKRITDKTKAIVVVHYCARPADMTKIMKIAKKHKLKVVEDVSHAHGALYKGKLVGTFGDVAAYSCMSGKSFATGEAGMLITNSREIYERAIVFGHYERHANLTIPELKAASGLPWGGYKYRMHQLSAAVGIVQLKKYKKEMNEIDEAMNYYWDLLEGVPGVKSLRVPKDSGSTMGGWYVPKALYNKEELGGLSVSRFVEAVSAEGVPTHAGCNKGGFSHPLLNTVDIYNDGKPTRIANSNWDVRTNKGPLPVAENIQTKVISAPYLKKCYKKIIQEHANAVKKVVENYKELLPGDKGDPKNMGGWGLSGIKAPSKKKK
ncbi:DegT/DnrJ/EryC1/StrS family aminotransferase [bacterium]|nr:DegT/DnrJ/EryC1/StrS family aminotransferase [bacterium]